MELVLTLNIDGELFRQQRRLLDRMMADLLSHDPSSFDGICDKIEDFQLLTGLINLTDEIADRAIESGIDCALKEDEEEQAEVAP